VNVHYVKVVASAALIDAAWEFVSVVNSSSQHPRRRIGRFKSGIDYLQHLGVVFALLEHRNIILRTKQARKTGIHLVEQLPINNRRITTSHIGNKLRESSVSIYSICKSGSEQITLNNNI